MLFEYYHSCNIRMRNKESIMSRTITGHTRLACLLGHPAAHSISPAMHNEAFEKLGLDGVYLAFDVTEDHLKKTLEALTYFNFIGCNLTMPLKTAVIPYLDELSDASRLSGSVNTIVNENGRLVGHTTDGIGYMDSLRAEGHDITGEIMTLLGAGGAARSIMTQAALDGVKEIRVFKRHNATYTEARAFAARISKETSCLVTVHDMADQDEMAQSIQESAILVNATNVGMGDDDTSLVNPSFLRQDLIVSDIIYHPAMTRLLKDAAAAGCQYHNGEFMLLYQGAASFKLWTGHDMPVEDVKKNIFHK